MIIRIVSFQKYFFKSFEKLSGGTLKEVNFVFNNIQNILNFYINRMNSKGANLSLVYFKEVSAENFIEDINYNISVLDRTLKDLEFYLTEHPIVLTTDLSISNMLVKTMDLEATIDITNDSITVNINEKPIVITNNTVKIVDTEYTY